MAALIRQHVQVAAYLAKLSVQRQLEYPFLLFSTVVALVFSYVWIGASFKLIVDRFQPLSGWTFPQLAFLYGLGLMSRGIISIFSFQTRQIDRLITRGQLDLFLLRPLNVIFQLTVERITLAGVPHLLIGMAFWVYGCQLVGFDPSPANLVKVSLVLAGGVMIHWAFFTAISSVAFWTLRSEPLVMASRELLARGTFYPLTIYPEFMQAILTFILPIGFISFYPTCDFLGADTGRGFPLESSLITPMVGALTGLLAVAVLNRGLKSYNSAGS